MPQDQRRASEAESERLYRNIAALKRFEISFKILAISVLFLCPPVIAQEQNGWQVDSLLANSNAAKPDAQQVYEVLLKKAEALHLAGCGQ